MAKRSSERARSWDASVVPPTGERIPASGRFRATQDRRSPLAWALRLGTGGDARSWRFTGGLPLRPGDGRLLTPATEQLDADETWDEGLFSTRASAADMWTVVFDGAKVRGRYRLRKDADAWTLQRVDEPSVKPFPRAVLPLLATPSSYPEDETAYAFEVKWDGIRALVHHDGRDLRVKSRNLNDITSQYPELQDLREALGTRDAVLDGEIVAFDERGLPSFQKLQGRLGVASAAMVRRKRDEVPIIYLVFDVLYLDGADTTQLPYEERRGLLEALDLGGPHVQLSPSYRGQGRVLLATPGLEGIVAKRLGSTYDAGARSRAWLKVKSQRRQELVIGGWTPGRGSRAGRIGSLLLGVYDKPQGKSPQRLLYAGNVGTGFTDQALDDLLRILTPFRTPTSPFAGATGKPDAIHVEPKLICEVEFTEWTSDGRLRHPSFKGLREDKDPRDVVREES